MPSRRYGAFVGAASGFRRRGCRSCERRAPPAASTEAAAQRRHCVDVEMGGRRFAGSECRRRDTALVSDAADGAAAVFLRAAVLGGGAGAPPGKRSRRRARDLALASYRCRVCLALDSAGALQAPPSLSGCALSNVVTDQTHCTAEWNVEGSSVGVALRWTTGAIHAHTEWIIAPLRAARGVRPERVRCSPRLHVATAERALRITWMWRRRSRPELLRCRPSALC